MKRELQKIAEVQTGYSFRSRLEATDDGAVAVIQMKDLTDDNRVDCSRLTLVAMEPPKSHHQARPGDLIFRSRGLTATSAILRDYPGVAVVAAPLLRIRVDELAVLPEYLNWFIRQTPAQSFLASRVGGTAQKMITKDTLEHLEVFLPPLESQQIIVKLARLAEEEQWIMKKLAERRGQYIAATLLQLAEGEK